MQAPRTPSGLGMALCCHRLMNLGSAALPWNLHPVCSAILTKLYALVCHPHPYKFDRALTLLA
jgi:hypothetical protein